MSSADIWDVYIASQLTDTHITWAGPNAGILPIPTPIHVITAHNPHECILSKQENTQRNNALLSRLKQLDVVIKPIISHSMQGDWQDNSFAIYGLSRQFACHIAHAYNQRGIFEILDNELLVIEVSSQKIKRRCPRNQLIDVKL